MTLAETGLLTFFFLTVSEIREEKGDSVTYFCLLNFGHLYLPLRQTTHLFFGGKTKQNKTTHHNGLFRDEIVKLDPSRYPEERQGNCLNADVSGLRSHLFCLEM